MSLALFMLITVGGGLLIGFVSRPGEWYRKLAKPWFTPPNSIFGPAWTALYFLIAIAGWRTFTRDPLGAAMTVWVIALLLNFVWSPVFFGLHRPTAALAVVLALLANILVFIFVSWRQDSVTALLFVPYAVWVAFAVVLNAAICRLNRSV